MWIISKDFNLCYGHRVWTQLLKESHCAKGDSSCKCKHLHGHEGKVTISLKSKSLNNEMVTDFKHLGWAKDVIDNNLDHKFIIDKKDPMFVSLVVDPYSVVAGCAVQDIKYNKVFVSGLDIGMTVDLSNIADSPIKETLESFFIVDFVPTSENLAKWMYDIASAKMREIDVKVLSVTWQETPKSIAVYNE